MVLCSRTISRSARSIRARSRSRILGSMGGDHSFGPLGMATPFSMDPLRFLFVEPGPFLKTALPPLLAGDAAGDRFANAPHHGKGQGRRHLRREAVVLIAAALPPVVVGRKFEVVR